MIEWVVWLVVVLVSWPFVVLTVEALAALWPVRRLPAGERVPCVVLVPAHNEETGLAATLANLQAQCQPGDRILVVADNCTDRTAAVARSANVAVSERQHATERGKGFALAHGLDQLRADAPPIVVIVDADCELAPGVLDRLVRQAHATQRPAQGIYLIGTGAESDPRRKLSAFAVLFKNQIRPLGLHRLGLPCLLTGTGMALPWEPLQQVPIGSGNIVEDMQLGIDLAVVGTAPQLCPAASLRGAAAPDRQAAKQQRTRWEHGHVQTLLTQTPRLLWQGLRQGRPTLWGLALEVGVPPLSFVVLMWAAAFAGCVTLWQCDLISAASAVSLGAVVVVFASSLLAAWLKYGRNIISLWVILFAPFYILWKVPIYLKLLFSRQKSWLRTKRG